jgi:hypothetical protein
MFTKVKMKFTNKEKEFLFAPIYLILGILIILFILFLIEVLL